jgi:hypothetical protein
MSHKVSIALLLLLTALNIMALSVNFSRPSRAATDGMNYQALISDPDFTRAVKTIAEACAVNVDTARLKC